MATPGEEDKDEIFTPHPDNYVEPNNQTPHS
jgi:hypothetical protein